jgi:hypothetical protein
MIKKITLVALLSVSSLYGFFDKVMESVSNPEIQKMAGDMIGGGDLVSSVSKNTNLDMAQSTNAISNILSYSKSNMSTSDYNTVSKSVPGIDQLLSNGLTKQIASSEALKSSFSAMGLDPSLITTITPLIIQYVTKVGGSESGNIISNSLSGLLK